MTTKEKLEIIFAVTNVLILCVNSYFIYRALYSPIDAVKIGRQLNDEQQKDNEKRRLFLILFSLRGSPISYEFVRALNQIDIVFEDTQDVLDAWHTHYDSLQRKEQVNAERNWDIQRTNLLSAMAVSLGYSRIRQTDMLQNYYPEGHANEANNDFEMRQAALTYYKNNAALSALLIQINNPPSDNDESN